MEISDTPPFFKTPRPNLTNPSLFIEFFKGGVRRKLWGTFIKGRGNPIMKKSDDFITNTIYAQKINVNRFESSSHSNKTNANQIKSFQKKSFQNLQK